MKILKQRYISKAMIPGYTMIVNGMPQPKSLETNCYVVQATDVNSTDEIISYIARFIHTDKDQVAQVAEQGMLRQTGNKVVKVDFLTDRQGSPIPSMIFNAKQWLNGPSEKYELHQIIIEYA
jgi:hypothetical protein